MLIVLASIVSVCIGLLSSHYAQKRGRDASTWFVLGVLLGIFAPILLFILPPVNRPVPEQTSPAAGSSHAVFPVTMSMTKEAVDNGEASTGKSDVSDTTAALLAKDWHYIDVNGKQEGPCPYGDLRLAAQREAVNSQSFVWTEGMSDWKRAGEVPDLSSELWPN